MKNERISEFGKHEQTDLVELWTWHCTARTRKCFVDSPYDGNFNFLHWTSRCLGHPANWSRHSLSAATSALDSTSRKVALRSEMSAGFSAFIASGPRQQVNFDSFRTYQSSSYISWNHYGRFLSHSLRDSKIERDAFWSRTTITSRQTVKDLIRCNVLWYATLEQ